MDRQKKWVVVAVAAILMLFYGKRLGGYLLDQVNRYDAAIRWMPSYTAELDSCYVGYFPNVSTKEREGKDLQYPIEIDGDGFRKGAEQPEEARCRLLATGDEETFGAGVPGAEAWPSRAGELLRNQGLSVTVLNGAMPLTSLAQQRVSLLGRWLDVRPKVALMTLSWTDLDDMRRHLARGCKLEGEPPKDFLAAVLVTPLLPFVPPPPPKDGRVLINYRRHPVGMSESDDEKWGECGASRARYLKLFEDTVKRLDAQGTKVLLVKVSEPICTDREAGGKAEPDEALYAEASTVVKAHGGRTLDVASAIEAGGLKFLFGLRAPNAEGHAAIAKAVADELSGWELLADCK